MPPPIKPESARELTGMPVMVEGLKPPPAGNSKVRSALAGEVKLAGRSADVIQATREALNELIDPREVARAIHSLITNASARDMDSGLKHYETIHGFSKSDVNVQVNITPPSSEEVRGQSARLHQISPQLPNLLEVITGKRSDENDGE